MNYLFIADVFYEDGYLGGAEVCNKELIFRLKERGHTVVCVHSFFCSVSFLEGVFKDAGIDRIIVGNFLGLSPNTVNLLTEARVPYFIYEHDFKFLNTRNPSVFPNNQAPPENVIYREFYENAYKVVVQSGKQAEIVKNHLHVNKVEVAMNLWSKNELDNLIKFKDNVKKYECAVLGHIYEQKNQKGAEQYCKENDLDYILIPHNTPHEEFCQLLSQCQNLVFFPQVFETLSRISVEGHCLSVELITNKNVSYLYESWSNLRNIDLIEYIKLGANNTVDIFEN